MDRNLLKSLLDEKLQRFILVGIVNTIVGTLIMFSLYNFASFSYWISSSANYILTSILSYFLNKHFTFQYKGNHWRTFLRFSFNIAICYVLAYGIAEPFITLLLANETVKVQENIAMIVGMVLFTAFNYLGQRFFTFK